MPAPRYAARKDESHNPIVDGLLAIGASVQELHALGRGCPDLLVGFRGCNYLIEVKTPGSAHAKRKVTHKHPTAKAQKEWRDGWRGRQPEIAETLEGALRIIGATRSE